MSAPSLCDIQGDIIQFPKRCEEFTFFRISDPSKFRESVPKLLELDITTGAHVREFRERLAVRDTSCDVIPARFWNIGFSKDGLQALGIKDQDLGDKYFSLGQLADSQALGDTGTVIVEDGHEAFRPCWDEHFLNRIDGVVLVAGSSDTEVSELSSRVTVALADAVTVVDKLPAAVLKNKGHEHFGWLDGISNPAVAGLTQGPLYKGTRTVRPGILLLGADGDPLQSTRPAWAVNGSFMVFRKLKQLVPEFKKFLKDNPVAIPDLPGRVPPEPGCALRCAWFFGRWPSGAPLELTPYEDNEEIAKDPEQINCFSYNPNDQKRCPYAAHIRKVNPRNTISPEDGEKHSIMRTGIPYGQEVGNDETSTQTDRGLAFVAYQSDIGNGFRNQQINWANNPSFPHNSEIPMPGFDAIIGQDNGKPRNTIDGQGKTLRLPCDFVEPRGGGYFFMPSIPALRSFFSPRSIE